MNSIEYFEKNRYLYLSEVLSKDVCKDLTQHMHNLHKEGKLVQDDQCPLSWSVYGDSKFDALLANLAKPIGEKLGLKIGNARTLLEFVAFSIGFVLGGKVGIASIIIVLSIGRVLQVFMPYFDLRK